MNVMNITAIDTGSKRIYKRNLNDGVYLIISKISPKAALSINSNQFLINEQFSSTSNHLFVIKYNDDEDYYTILALQTHQIIGIQEKSNSNYSNSNIIKTNGVDNKLIQWEIQKQSDNYYTINLKNTDYYIEINSNKSQPILNKKSGKDSQQFSIKTYRLIEENFISISPIYEKRQFLSFSKNSQSIFLLLNESSRPQNNQIFYLLYDPNDGCYFIINLENMKSFTASKNSSENSFVLQETYFAYEHQKWIICPYSKNKDYCFIESKESLLRLDINMNINNSLIISKFDPHKKEQFFILNKAKCSQLKNERETIKTITKEMEFKYRTEINLNPHFDTFKWELFEYCYLMTELFIPVTFKKIPRNAFANCKRIKTIFCDPKWLKLLPNPLNVENVIVLQGVVRIDSDSFKGFQNLKTLVLPGCLEFESCDPNTFEDIYNLISYEGDPIFLKYIHKLCLENAFIPFYVKEIPEEAFIGCRALTEVKIENDSRLKIIKSKSFANCRSLTFFDVPETVENIAPNAFDGCHENFNLKVKNENQRFSMVQGLILKPELEFITSDYKKFINIENLEIPLTVEDCEPDVLDSFEHLSFVKCDPKWLNHFNVEKIQGVFIPQGITEFKTKDFEYLNNLRFLEIPKSVTQIEANAFNACENLVTVKCGFNHLQSLNRKQIKTLIINDNTRKIYRNSFEGFINLETCELPENIEYISPNAFIHCKKLMNVNNELAEQFINNKMIIDDDATEIFKDDFEGWVNLQFLEIPNSIEEIEEGSFDDCVNLRFLKCDPKWFHYIPKYSIREIEIPEFVTELKTGQFDGFNSLTKIILPKRIIIKDHNIFDSCECLVDIKCENYLFKTFSKTTKERCTQRKVRKFVKPVYNFQPNKKKVHNETIQTYKSKPEEDDDEEKNDDDNEMPPETSIDDVVNFDRRYDWFKDHIERVYKIINGEIPTKEEPSNKILKEISIICGSICHKIKSKFNIIPRPVQVFAILCLSNEILNSRTSKGAIGEIKTGEGKTLIISILSIILVKYKRKVDIITSNMELANRDQKEQSRYFSLFGIPTGVLYHKQRDGDFIPLGVNIFSSIDITSPYRDFNIDVFNKSVVYSTNANFEFVYLHSLYNNVSRKREFDVVLVDEVDNMFIDQSRSPAIISRPINYAFSRDILEIVFQLQTWKVSEIIKVLKYYLPNAGEFKEDDIEVLKNAALNAVNSKKGVDYIIEENDIVIIDQNTGFKRKGTKWSGYIHEMVQIKEGIEIEEPHQSFCQISNYAYINLYNKIAGVTGTIGSENDEKIIKDGYNVTIFKVPRHKTSQLEVFIKKRPDNQTSLYKLINSDIKREVSKGRPVLVICDSIFNADHLFENLPTLHSSNVQKITAVVPESDRNAIVNAGTSKTVTIATSAAGRGVDIKLSQESLDSGGLHVIIPYKMRNQRSLEQAVGRAGRQGQPGSVTIFVSENDKYEKEPGFSKGDENLVEIERTFWDNMKANFSWMFSPKQYTFKDQPIFPYAADYTVLLKILCEMISFSFPNNPVALGIQYCKVIEVFKNLCMETVMLAWGNFFNKIYSEKTLIDDIDYCRTKYNDFMTEFSSWFSPSSCKSAVSAFVYLKAKLEKEKGLESVIVNGVKITTFFVSVIFPESAPAVRLFSGAALHGGLNVYHALQNDDKVNWARVLISAGCGVVKGVLMEKNSILNNILIGVCDGILNDIDDTTNVRKRPKFPPLPDSIRAISAVTSICIISYIKEKLEIPPPPPVKPLNFKPRVVIQQLDIDFIKKTMKMAKDAYDGKFENGKLLFSSENNTFFNPFFYCIDEGDVLYVAIRGSDTGYDWCSDFCAWETKVEIKGNEIFIHSGFYNAAAYILETVDHILTDEKYKTIYFVGHSYGGGVSSVLCLLTKGQDKFKDKEIYAMCYAPPPAMSYCPSNISKCIFAFIHRFDIVPHCSALNILNSASVWGFEFIRKFQDMISKINDRCLRAFVAVVISNLSSIAENIGLLHVTKVKGVIFAIGLNKSTCLNDCRICYEDLPNTVVLTPFCFFHHKIDNYVKAFDRFTF